MRTLTNIGISVTLLFGLSVQANAQQSASAQVERAGSCQMAASQGCAAGQMGDESTAADSSKHHACPMMGGMGMQHGGAEGGMGMQHGGAEGGMGMQHGAAEGGMGMRRGASQDTTRMTRGASEGSMGMHGADGGAGMQHGAQAAGMAGMAGCPMMEMNAMTMDGGSMPFSEATIAAIEEALQDEFRSEAMYQRILDDHGAALPFSQIVKAEQRHSMHLIGLLDANGSKTPESRWNAGNSPTFASIPEACTASVAAEADNVAIYDRLLGADLPETVRSVFEHLRMISLERHLPAFERCSAR